MSKVSTNISLDADLKAESIALFKELGMDLSTAITVFLKQSLREQGMPFKVTRNIYNRDTIQALNEYEMMKKHPEKYKRYDSFEEALNEVLNDE